MSDLNHVKKAAQKKLALLECQYSNAKAYRGVPYQKLTNMKPAMKPELMYRGVPYKF